MICKLCSSDDISVAYEGKIRDGCLGDYLDNAKVMKCGGCGVKFLEEKLIKGEGFYQTRAYRDKQGDDSKPNIPLIMTNMEFYRDFFEGSFKDLSILDVGSGYGWNAEAMRYNGPTVDTVDLDPEMPADIGHISAVAEDCYDVVTAFTVIENVEYPLEWLLELRTKLKKNGTILLSTPVQTVVEDNINYYRTQHNWYFEWDSLRRLLTKAGFHDNCGMEYKGMEGNVLLYTWAERDEMNWVAPEVEDG